MVASTPRGRVKRPAPLRVVPIAQEPDPGEWGELARWGLTVAAPFVVAVALAFMFAGCATTTKAREAEVVVYREAGRCTIVVTADGETRARIEARECRP